MRFLEFRPERLQRVPIILPVLGACLLVSLLTFQAVRSTQVHQRALERALRDYAAFITWQYSRRASDYLRLTIVTATHAEELQHHAVACDIPDISEGRIVLETNPTRHPDTLIARALSRALSQMGRSRMQIGLVQLAGPPAHQLLGYWFRADPGAQAWHCVAVVLGDSQLVQLFRHVAGFAPLLPPGLGGDMPQDSLVSLQLLSADGTVVASMGNAAGGIAASDTLGPDLAGLRVRATLRPVAARRLVAGGLPASDMPVLVSMLLVTLLMCAIAIAQVRRTQEIVRLRNDFVTSVSHELKTPLTQISLFADTLASPRERSREERQQYIAIISRESKRLGQLVDSILHFAGMMQAGVHALAREAVLLGEEIREAIAAFELIAEGRSATIHLRVLSDVEVVLERDAFRQVMLNLLDNAIKYGPDGQTIAVSLEATNTGARILVDDAGPGIPVGERTNVFEAFVRADRGANTAGSGIGLAVVRDVVMRHSGSVRILESPAGGARVEINLPAGA